MNNSDKAPVNGVPEELYKKRLSAGWDPEKAKNAPLSTKKVFVDHTGRKFYGVRAMCQFWGVNVYTYKSRLAHGWDLKKALTTKKNFSVMDKAREISGGKLKINPSTIYSRRRAGWEDIYIYTKPARAKKAPKTDHTGREFSSVKEMCKAWNVTTTMFYRLLSQGQKIEDILTRKKMKKSFLDQGREMFGEIAPGLTNSVCMQRKKAGWPLKDIFMHPLHVWRKTIKDHEGNEFKNLDKMCAFYGISPAAFYDRKNKGWGLKKILTTPKNAGNKILNVADHLGNIYPTLGDMIDFYNITKNVFYSRRKAGWPMEKILTTPLTPRGKLEYNGVIYQNAEDLCITLDLDYDVLKLIHNKGYSVNEAIELLIADKSNK